VGCSKIGAQMKMCSSTKCHKRKCIKINNVNFYLGKLEKGKFKPNMSRRKEINKIRAEISEVEKRKMIEKIHKTKQLVL
jgi:predicted transcriptional regulator